MNERFMARAIALAKEAAEAGEIPVGAVIVKNGEIIGEGSNRCEELSDPTAHAEILAIKAAAERIKDWRLSGCALFVTLEPCPMCAGAIINSRIETLVFGAYDKRAGSCCNESVINLFSSGYPNSPQVFGGIKEEECKALMQEFFKYKRA